MLGAADLAATTRLGDEKVAARRERQVARAVEARCHHLPWTFLSLCRHRDRCPGQHNDGDAPTEPDGATKPGHGTPFCPFPAIGNEPGAPRRRSTSSCNTRLVLIVVPVSCVAVP